jgi:predicted ArsR family transcriptional regulator
MGTRAEKSGKSDVRQLILRFLKLKGKASVHDVARHLRIGHEGARKHLIQMEEAGWIARSPGTDAKGQGRPTDLYAVTAEGDRLFPKAYDRLSIVILEALRNEGGKTAANVLAALARAQVEDWTPRLEGKDIREKLEALKGLYQKADPFATVEPDDGDYLLIERNCPFLNVAMEHPVLCSLSVSTLETLLGRKVIREERFQAGHGRCVFRIKMDSPAPKGGFRLESPAPPSA